MLNPHHFLIGGKILQHHLSSLIRPEECIYLIRRYSSCRIAAKDLKTLHLGKHKSYSQLQSLFSPLTQWCSCRCILKPKQKSDPTNVKILDDMLCPRIMTNCSGCGKKSNSTNNDTGKNTGYHLPSLFSVSSVQCPLKKEKSFILYGK